MSLTKCHPRLCPTCTCLEPHTCSDEEHINHSPHSRGQCAPTCLQLPQGWCFQKGGWPWNTPGLSPPSWCSPHSAPCCSGSPGIWKTKITTITKTFIREGRGARQHPVLAAVFTLPLYVRCAPVSIICFQLQTERRYLSESEPKWNYIIQK